MRSRYKEKKEERKIVVARLRLALYHYPSADYAVFKIRGFPKRIAQ